VDDIGEKGTLKEIEEETLLYWRLPAAEVVV
jgi:hypothetical protein